MTLLIHIYFPKEPLTPPSYSELSKKDIRNEENKVNPNDVEQGLTNTSENESSVHNQYSNDIEKENSNGTIDSNGSTLLAVPEYSVVTTSSEGFSSTDGDKAVMPPSPLYIRFPCSLIPLKQSLKCFLNPYFLVLSFVINLQNGLFIFVYLFIYLFKNYFYY
jgi:hypothetical protein